MAPRTVAVIDGNSLMHRAFHALPETMTAPDGRPTNAAFGFLSMLVKLVGDVNPDGVVVAFDRGKPAFRIEALAQYKVHRPPTAEGLRTQFPMVKELLEAMEVPIVELDGWEGDDILGTLAVRGAEKGLRVLLVTGDRDAFQLVNDSVTVVTTRKGITDIAFMGPDDVLERYGITPAQVPDYLGLKGDTSDNIPGVPGVGEKTAAKLLQEHGSLEAVLEAAKAGRVKGKVGENLVAHEGAALASRVVATIVCDVPVDIDLEGVVFGTWDDARLARAFGELRFTSLLERALALRASAGGAGGAAPAPAGARGVASAGGADHASRRAGFGTTPPAPEARDAAAGSLSAACAELGCVAGTEGLAAGSRVGCGGERVARGGIRFGGGHAVRRDARHGCCRAHGGGDRRRRTGRRRAGGTVCRWSGRRGRHEGAVAGAVPAR